MTSVVERDAVTTAGRVHRLMPGTELLGEYRDSAYEEPKFLVQRADGQAMQLPRLLYRVACSLDGRGDGEIAADLSAELGTVLTAEQVSFLVEERLAPVGLVVPEGSDTDRPGDGTVAPPMPVRNDLLLALRYRVGVIPAGVVWRIAGVFQPLFRRPVWSVLLATFVLVDAWIALQGNLLDLLVSGVGDMGRRPGLVLAVLGLTVLSGVLHEFGHVGACRYGGGRPGDIGVGLYLVWPAFYSTVTDSYRLDRVGRLRTDLGGLYIDAVFMAGLGLVYLHTGEAWLLIALLGMHVEAAWQLLPSLRLDGYYILADLVGVPDLFSYVRPTLLSLLPGRTPPAAVRELKPRSRRIIVLWVAAVVPTLLFWLAVLLVALPRLLPAAWHALLDYLQVLDRAARDGAIVTTTVGVTELMFLLLPWAGGAMALWMLVTVAARPLAARSGLARVGTGTWAAARRLAALAGLVGIGALLVLRVAQVARSHPATAEETRLAESALSAVHEDARGPAVGAAEWLVREQLVLFARATGAFERHSTVVAGAREMAVLACAVLVVLPIVLVGMRRLPPLAVGLPLLATLAMGPAVTTFATVGSGTVGAAWAAAGVVLLACSQRRGTAVVAALAVTVGVATEPLVAVPLVAALAAWPSSRRARHAGPKDVRRWLAVALILPLGAVVAALASGPTATAVHGTPLDASERTVLLLTVGVLVAAGLLLRPLRPWAVAAGAATVPAALSWPGTGDALALALVTGTVLAVLVAATFIRRQVAPRPNPLHRAAVAVPVLVLVLVGALFLPASAPVPPHAALASWITAPDGPSGTLLVPPGLWGDLVRDGVPPSRLVRAGTGVAADADWTVTVGAPTPGTEPAATFVRGATVLTVAMSEQARAEAQEQAQAQARAQEAARAEEAARQATQLQQVEQQTARRSFGSLLTERPGFTASPAALAALRDGSVDMRVLVVLDALTQEYAVTVSDVPVAAGDDGSRPRHQVLITSLAYRPISDPEAATFLTQWLAAWAPPFTPSAVTPGPDGLLVGWVPKSPPA
ncbi:hypothetical protein [Blastococcus deserti]|uniref:Peptide zinc metalloprotease protein n=1 Tax=Blastococcus deserti TaxID=2259033 RepID=A0ABW4XAB1_9ACTN